MQLIMPDGAIRNYDENILVKDVIKDISEGLYRNTVGALVNGKILGMLDEIEEGGEFKALKFDDQEGKEIFWHTSAHILAHAVKNLWPDSKFAIGPAIDNGFYYDIDTEHRFSPEDLDKIEKEMKSIAKKDLPVIKKVISRNDALKMFKDLDEIYKVELIESIPEDETISLYEIGDFVDLCRGPHLEKTGKIKQIKLLSIAGAYWRGDENNKMLQRIYGISFEKKKELDKYVNMLEEAAKRDHRKIGKDLELFTMHEEGPGFPFFHPNGMIIRNQLESWWRKVLEKNGYGEIMTPIILNEALWHKSGHWDHYRENMYFTKIDGADYAIKPMNCPGSTLVYSSSPHSYRDLPIRLSEFGQVHRHELSGALHGLFRVRTFTQDDAHVYCLPSQIQDEIFKMLDLAMYLYDTFGFDYKFELSTRPEDSMGSDEQWNIAIDALKKALEEKGIDYKVNEGDGAFYGPKIDIQLTDAIGRPWQCGTIQLDFQMPENFDLTYVNEQGEKARPVMIHRALLGSIERFIGVLIEHFAGNFPLWISPVQIKVIPISERFTDYANEINKMLIDKGFRSQADLRSEKLGYKIREAQLKKINYVIVIGEKEVNDKTISVRKRGGIDLGTMKVEEFIEKITEERDTKAIE
ncbi:MAG: threonine--tRNA ligase [Tissierellia bacterium]|nr:threonine--tRNA ligase [Tissierellia bacterium]